MWGVAAQVYSLRRAGDGGIGDAGAVRDLAEAAARHGADAVALSPVHSLFPARSGALRPLLAVEPAVPQSALRRSGGDLRCRAPSPPTTRLERASADRLGRRRRCQVRPPARLFDEFDAGATRRCCASSSSSSPRAARPCASMPASRPSRRMERQVAPTRYHLFLQWITARSFAAAQQAAKARRHAHRPDQRPRDRHGPRRQPCLGAPAPTC